jgi:hypothetical protein
MSQPASSACFTRWSLSVNSARPAKNQLRFQKRIPITGCLATFFVVDVKPEIEAAKQLDKPLVHERLGNQDQNALRSAGENKAMEDQAGFNGFAQANLIGKQDARRKARRHFGSDIKLVGQQIDSPAQESSYGRLPSAVLMLESGNSQVKNIGRIELACKQPFLRLVEADRIAQVLLVELLLAALVSQQAVLFGERLDREGLAFAVLNRIANPETHAPQRSIVAGIFSLLAAGPELHE